MPLKELQAKYGGTKRTPINRAIRAECPGGDEALDALELLHHMAQRHGWKLPNGQPSAIAVAYQKVLEIVDAMEAAIRERYGLPPRVPEGYTRR